MVVVCIGWNYGCRMAEPCRQHWLRAALVFCVLFCVQNASATPRVGVMTMQPGAEYWARFGHNALLVDLQDGSEPLSYNFGYFDFEQPGFLSRFLRGDMRYLAVALPLSRDLSSYASEQRGVTVQWLNLNATQTDRLIAHLREHVKPENAEYRYDYFTANCSTKVRDALDSALRGQLHTQLRSRSQGLTYRFEALRHASELPWLLWGMDLGLGPMADKPLTVWQQSFIPQRLAEALRESVTADGQPLVQRVETLIADGPTTAADEPPSQVWTSLGVGILLAALMQLPLRSTPRVALLALLSFASTLGLTGFGLLALWLLTDHVAAWQNANLLLFNPLFAIVLGSGAWRAFRRGTHPTQSNLVRLASTLWWVSVLLGWVVLQLGKYPQAQSAWLTMLLPPLVVIAFSARRPSRV
jgi:hypothetical protein